jgi:hypothetical protein
MAVMAGTEVMAVMAGTAVMAVMVIGVAVMDGAGGAAGGGLVSASA